MKAALTTVAVVALLAVSVPLGLGVGRLGHAAFERGPSAAAVAAIDRGRPAPARRAAARTTAHVDRGVQLLWQAYPLTGARTR